MRKYFITGLVILLPLALTIIIVAFLFNLLTDPFVGVVREILSRYGLLETGFLFLTGPQLQHFVSQLLILVFLFLFTVLLGVIARWFFVHYIIRLSDYIFHRIPIVRSIYKTTQDVIKTIFATETRSFKQVVIVPFPNPKTYSIGLVTRENLEGTVPEGNTKFIAVFVPTTPNPTSGFLMMFKKEDLIFLDLSVEDAFKYIISCGVIQTPFNQISASEAANLIAEEETPGEDDDESNESH